MEHARWTARSLTVLAAAALWAVIAFAPAGDTAGRCQTPAEIVRYDPGYHSALAVGAESGSLFTFSLNGARLVDISGQTLSADCLTTGTLVMLTGPGYRLESYPAQYPGVTEVRVTGARPDFIALHYDAVFSQIAAADAEDAPALLRTAADSLPELTDGEKEALSYELSCALGLF